MLVAALNETLVCEVLEPESTLPCLKVMLHNPSPLDLITSVPLAAVLVQAAVVIVVLARRIAQTAIFLLWGEHATDGQKRDDTETNKDK